MYTWCVTACTLGTRFCNFVLRVLYIKRKEVCASWSIRSESSTVCISTTSINGHNVIDRSIRNIRCRRFLFFSFPRFIRFACHLILAFSLSLSLSLPHSWPLIESFRGKISNVLASFFCSFLFHVHLFNEVFFLAPMVPFFLLVPLSELGTKGECNFSSLRYFYDPLGTRVEKRPPILLSSLSHFH